MPRTFFYIIVLLTCSAIVQAASDTQRPINTLPSKAYQQTPANSATSDPNNASMPTNTHTHDDKCDDRAIRLGKCRPSPPATNIPIAPASTSTLNPIKPKNHFERPSAKFIPASPAEQYEQGQILLYFTDSNTSNLRIQQIEQKLHMRPVQRIDLNALGGEIVQYLTEDDLVTLKGTLKQIAPEATIDMNHYYYSMAGPRQYFASHIRLNMPPSKASKVPIGIIDTDIADIAALKSSRITRRQFLQPSNKPASSQHGTAVALLIAGKDENNQFYGVVPGATLFAASTMRKAGKQNNTNTLLFAQAIDWLITEKVRIINLSLGGSGDAIMQNLFKKLEGLPILLIAAAGNGGPNAPPSYPAAYPNVIAVTATNANQQIYKHANQGSYIDIAAPGEDIWVPVNKEGQYMSGTSFSAALVSGVISRLLSTWPEAASNKIRQLLCSQALELGQPGRDDVYGCGLLQSVSLQ
jgi:subtilisin family serine protease